MKRGVLVLAVLAGLLSGGVQAGEVYPIRPVVRLFGTNQGNVGDCEAEAQTMAMETAFANRDLPVRFSLFYRHVYNWENAPVAQQEAAKLSINDQDKAIINRMGPWIPDYMWPEDAEGYDPSFTGVRPHVSEAAAIDTDFPSVSSMGYGESFYTYAQSPGNRGSLAALKQAIDQRLPITLTIHSAIFQPLDVQGVFVWDDKTGLLQGKYTPDALNQAIKNMQDGEDFVSGMDHSVAVVGYDDSLYADKGYAIPGAIIIRNSWNYPGEIAATATPGGTPAEMEDLKKMRLKISPINLPGYYALPMQYVADMFAHNELQHQGYVIYSINYMAYSVAYQQFATRYQVFEAPYTCDFPNLGLADPTRRAKQELTMFSNDLALYNSTKATSEQKEGAVQSIYNLAVLEASSKYMPFSFSSFRYARVSRNVVKKIDRLSDFYGGKFNGYYCNSGFSAGSVWPGSSALGNPGYVKALSDLSVNVGSPENWIELFAVMDQEKLDK